jgi:cellulose biosynthesis protein BcsQ
MCMKHFPKPYLITVGNTKGGSGKSWIALNLAAFLAKKLDYWVLLIDADSQKSLGRDIATMMERGEDGGFHYLPDSSPGADGGPLRDHLDKIPDSSRYDFIVIDTPPTLDNVASAWAYKNCHTHIIPIPGEPCDFEDFTGTLIRSLELNEVAHRVSLPVKLHSFLNKEMQSTTLQKDFHQNLNKLRDSGIEVLGSHDIWTDYNSSMLEIKCRYVYSRRETERGIKQVSPKFQGKVEACMASIVESIANHNGTLPKGHGNQKLSSMEALVTV